MDKRTRMLNAMNNKPVDHVPVGFWFHFGGEETLGQANIDAHLKYVRETDLDFVKVMCDGYFPFPLPKITCAADWAKVEPLPEDHPFIREQVERAKGIVSQIGAERCVFYNVFAPFSSLRFGAGDIGVNDATVMAHLREDPKAVMHALDAIAWTNARLSELLIEEAGCDGVYYCVQGGEYDRFAEGEYERWIRPSDLYVLERANRASENNIMHMCGWAGAKNRLELWRDYPVKVVNWASYVEDLDMPDGTRFFGGRASLGGFETLWDDNGGKHRDGILYNGTKEELQAYTKDLILDHGKRGLILGGDCTIAGDLDWERIRWVIEAAREV